MQEKHGLNITEAMDYLMHTASDPIPQRTNFDYAVCVENMTIYRIERMRVDARWDSRPTVYTLECCHPHEFLTSIECENLTWDSIYLSIHLAQLLSDWSVFESITAARLFAKYLHEKSVRDAE